MRIVRILLWFLQLLVGAVAIAVAISPFRQQFSSGEIAYFRQLSFWGTRTKFHAVQQKNREWLLLSSLRWTPSLTCPWNPRQLLRSLLDGHRAQCTFHCSLRVLLSVGHDANDHNLLLKGRPFIMR